jgi:hypothetical protein
MDENVKLTLDFLKALLKVTKDNPDSRVIQLNKLRFMIMTIENLSDECDVLKREKGASQRRSGRAG